MKSEEIKRLLEKYYEGESTVEEEVYLKNFFSLGNIPEDLINEKEIFSYYLKSAIVPEPSLVFEKNIIAALDSIGEASLDQKRRRAFGIFTSVAALILILTGSYFFFIHNGNKVLLFQENTIIILQRLSLFIKNLFT